MASNEQNVDLRCESGATIELVVQPAHALFGLGLYYELGTYDIRVTRGGVATRNFCSLCNSLVFGGVVGESDSFTIYVGSLDDKSLFQPKVAIFARNRPSWVTMPKDLTVFDTMPAAS